MSRPDRDRAFYRFRTTVIAAASLLAISGSRVAPLRAQTTNPNQPTTGQPPTGQPTTGTGQVEIFERDPDILPPDLAPAANLTTPWLLADGQPVLVGEPLGLAPAIEPVAIIRGILPEAPLLKLEPTSPVDIAPAYLPTGLRLGRGLLELDPSLFANFDALNLGPLTPTILILPGEGGSTTVQYQIISPANIPNQPQVGSGPVQTLALSPQMQSCPTLLETLRETAQEQSPSLYTPLIECYQQNLAVAREYQNAAWETYALNNLASIHFVLADYAQALSHYQDLLALSQARSNSVEAGMAQSGIGATHAALGDYESAIAHYQSALAQLPEAIVPQWRSLTLRNLGSAYLAQNQLQPALEQQQQALVLAKSIQDRYGEAQALGNLGHTYSRLERYGEAVAAYEQSLAIAQAITDPLQTAQAWLGLGTVYSYQQQFTQAEAPYRKALQLSQTLGAKLGEGIALNNLGDVLSQLQRFSEAERLLYQGVTVWESLRAGLGNNDSFKVSIFETQADTYRNLQTVLVAQEKSLPALEVSERGRARAFVELMARRLDRPQASLAAPNVRQIQQIAAAQNTTIVTYSILRDQFVQTPHSAAVQFTQEAQETTLLIWVVQPSGAIALRQVNLQTDRSLIEQVRAVRTALGAGGDRSIGVVASPQPVSQATTPLRELHQRLIAPIADLLPGDASAPVVFIPQETLFLVPFAALQDSTGEYLVQRHTLLTAPSIQTLSLTQQLNQQQFSPTMSALIVGNPAMPALPNATRSPLAALPGAATEAQAIAQLLNTQALVGAAASETAVKQQLSQARLVHLATHGLLEDIPDLGIPGALALAPGAGADGWLTASEIFNLQLQADLVVLSACDTGRGTITGDGVIGLSRSLMAAGTPSVLVSLWAISDTSTVDLMTTFYQQLQQTPSYAQALRQAMLTTMQQYPHPRDWAAFTLSGQSQ
ncbi:CHAT domain-containing tetratricopeptide repeat protein [Sphaerothrix gracilis]|uniref:CHAT domain-containing protein n=1 Tax=Sphaerothrix gracilis TaxID=3151835 RepID=UPI0031FD4585